MLTIDRLCKTYPNGTHALETISLDVDAGEIVALEGAERRAWGRSGGTLALDARLHNGRTGRGRAPVRLFGCASSMTYQTRSSQP